MFNYISSGLKIMKFFYCFYYENQKLKMILGLFRSNT